MSEPPEDPYLDRGTIFCICLSIGMVALVTILTLFGPAILNWVLTP